MKSSIDGRQGLTSLVDSILFALERGGIHTLKVSLFESRTGFECPLAPEHPSGKSGNNKSCQSILSCLPRTERSLPPTSVVTK